MPCRVSRQCASGAVVDAHYNCSRLKFSAFPGCRSPHLWSRLWLPGAAPQGHLCRTMCAGAIAPVFARNPAGSGGAG